ncbi:hypothetical protein [Micromonospora sp. WMMD980]|uniref:hypothetical protein n=1 Tax=Micromonospora sp. WMMD980 TaxID=3016088 RepID=UPI002416721F|nr:hypothetical protein [Micromonospora sp. WMMD980]MDG4803643.1 hypothetical protein [Micromonospora sp. WMMD980]
MAHHLFAVLVRAGATVVSIDAHLDTPMRLVSREHRIDGYRLGGQVTGAWDPRYDPDADPRNWHTCDACHGATHIDGAACPACADATQAGRRPGTVVPWSYTEWAPYPGDIVALPRLLHPGWRFPPGRTPVAWVDLAGVVWLDTDAAYDAVSDSGQVPARLGMVFRDLVSGRRNPDPMAPTAAPRGTVAGRVLPARGPGRLRRAPVAFRAADWSVAVVDAHA